MDIEDKHKQRKGKKTSIEDSRGREDREKKRRRETRTKKKRERIRRGNENKEMSLKLLYIDIKKRSLR